MLDGVIAVYISEGVDFELTNYYALTAIREALGSVDDQVTGLVQSTYLGPEIVNPSALETSDADNGSLTNDPGSTSTSLVLFAVGGCAVLASVGLIYYLRRRNRNGDSGEATMAAGTDHQGFSRDGTDRPLSPFSEMLPSAYRFDQDGNMSAIMELDDESATQRSGIVVSDSGFTTEEENSLAISSFDGGSSSMNRSGSPVLLGARKRPPVCSFSHLLN